MPTGVSSARHFVTGGAAPPARWCKKRRRGNRPASIHAGMPIADPSPSGRSLRSRGCFVPAHFCPQKYCGGQKWPVGYDRKAASPRCFLFPLRPGGVRGVKGERGIAGFSLDRSRWSLKDSGWHYPAPASLRRCDQRGRAGWKASLSMVSRIPVYPEIQKIVNTEYRK